MRGTRVVPSPAFSFGRGPHSNPVLDRRVSSRGLSQGGAAIALETAATVLPIHRAPPALRGLLVTGDQALARSFRRELRDCADCAIVFDVTPSLDGAPSAGAGAYDCVTVDLDGAAAPSEAVRLARRSWPNARIAVVSCWWSEREQLARDLADLVVHKPLRAPELRAFLRAAGRDPKRSSQTLATGTA